METLIPRLGLALAIGLLVGLERGWRERDAVAGSRTAGLRTYGISGLLGGSMAALSSALASPFIFAAGLVTFGLIFAWFKLREAEHDSEFSVTGVIAGLCVFVLGGLAVSGDYRAAAAGGAALSMILASREALHGFLKRLSWLELRSAVMLAVMTAIVLPLLPDRPLDPWGGLNLWQIWFFTVLTAAISYLGYIAVRLLGQSRGLLLSALAGSLISSTAVTLTFARAAKTGANARPLAGAAMLAAAVSILRVGVLILVIEPKILELAGLPMAAAAVVFVASGAVLLARERYTASESPPVQDPFEIGPLLLFAALFAIVSTASAALVSRFGSGSLVTVSAVSGLLDVDVAVLSALRTGNQPGSEYLTALAILSALAANALCRFVIAASAGPRRFWGRLCFATVFAIGAGCGALLFIPRP
ncbi:MgtC/SapB family protein [soil metagenome]